LTENKFKVELIYLLPILASLLFGLVCTWLLYNQPLVVDQITPTPPGTPGAPVYDMLYIGVLIAISGSVFYLLIKHRNKKIITGLIVVSLTAAAVLMSLIYLPALFARTFPELYSDTLLVILTIIITILLDLAIFKFGSKTGNVAVILLGGALGVFLGKYLPIESIVAILIFLAVYDVIAVYRGPVGKIAQSATGLDELRGLSYSFKDIQMGLGDLVFYSVLVSGIFFFASDGFFNLGLNPVYAVIPYAVSVIGILVGAIVTFYMLERREVFPGLPFPIMLGLGSGLLTYFLLSIL
jgi:presenilin-like A22 family membrane protease